MPPATRAYQACWHRCSNATARWCTARAEPPSTNTPCPARRAMDAVPIFSTADRALEASLTGPSYSSTTTSVPPPRAELWSRIGGSSPRSAHTVPKSGWLCTAQPTSSRSLCSSRCSGIPSGTGQSPSTTRPSRSMRNTCGRAQFRPGQQPRVAQQRAVAQVDGDVPGQVVVVPLPPQGAGEHHELLARRQVGDELLGGRREHASAPLRAAGRDPGADGGRARPRSRCTWRAAQRPGCAPSTSQ